MPTGELKVDRVLEPVRTGLRWLGLALLGVMIATPAIQVVLRQFFGVPMIGAEEFSRFMLISVVMLALPYTVSAGASVRMDELLLSFPARVQTALTVLIAAVSLVAFAYVAYSIVVATLSNLNNSTPTLGLPYYIFFSAGAVGCLMAAVEFGVVLYKALTGRPVYVTFAAERSDDAELVL